MSKQISITILVEGQWVAIAFPDEESLQRFRTAVWIGRNEMYQLPRGNSVGEIRPSAVSILLG